MQVSELIEELKTLPQDAAVHVADGQSYRLKEDYPDWNEDDNRSFPLDFVQVRHGRSAQEMQERQMRSKVIVNPEMLPPAVAEPAVMATLVGVR